MKKLPKYLLLVAITFAILMNFPVLGIFNKEISIGSFPLLYIYIFGVWIVTIVFLWVISEIRKEEE